MHRYGRVYYDSNSDVESNTFNCLTFNCDCTRSTQRNRQRGSYLGHSQDQCHWMTNMTSPGQTNMKNSRPCSTRNADRGTRSNSVSDLWSEEDYCDTLSHNQDQDQRHAQGRSQGPVPDCVHVVGQDHDLSPDPDHGPDRAHGHHRPNLDLVESILIEDTLVVPLHLEECDRKLSITILLSLQDQWHQWQADPIGAGAGAEV